MSVALLVFPDFMLVALGWALRHKLGFSREFFAGTERLVYFVLFPALLFQSILRTPITAGNAALLLQATASVIAAGVAMAWLAVTGFWLLFRTMWRHDFAWISRRRTRNI